MEYGFYICSFIAIMSTFFTIIQKNAVYSLFYLIISLLSISGIFFSIGALFAGALEVIIYAGAIIVLFVFVIMTLNFENEHNIKSKKIFTPIFWILSGILSLTFFLLMSYAIFSLKNQKIERLVIDAKIVGISLFGPYVLLVEVSSLLLLAALIVVFHISGKKKHIK
ncbi:NADH:ubiquinone oxidoreductase subunit J [Buchnera aphidicola (Diuraphis noxia)]|uniref:NADH-quinone oxidoreductase subunit J n=1 Tax=Buchnera aphidicola subsp. Diuraphis noxia TaxID=118101 RepID=A0A1B2H8A1_BUCDN|nr:NADH-quinone oxidoreductase subunit J [Buchnera aphidicola]ANZ22392.1 NADH:ubiquinone oxidoreductase subunit J [Buchnera aphidicola (Diuraphis noxia)]